MASVSERPSKLYRAAVRELLTQFEPAAYDDPEAGFFEYLEANHRAEKARLASSPTAQAPPTQVLAIRNGLFVLAAGLLAHGRIEVAEELLDFLPSSGAVRNLALALEALLPLPDALSALRDPEAVRAWLREHRDRLRWDEERGVYVTWDDKQ